MTPDRPLPPQVKRDLDAIAAGRTRQPTRAHPDCVCGDLTGEVSRYYADADGNPMPLRYGPADCPQHRPEPA